MSEGFAVRTQSQVLVVCICVAPLVAEGLAMSLGRIAQVRWLPARQSFLPRLLRALGPDAVVVESEQDAAEALPFADQAGVLLVQVPPSGDALRLRNGGRWETRDGGAPDSIRDLIVGAVLGRGVV